MTNSLTSLASPAEITMTSIEMVKYLNDERRNYSYGYAEVNHSDFMRRVPKVLGEGTAPKFLGSVNYSSGNGAISTRATYVFPKREACLMAMSYSYELQAKVFDHMTALEAKLSTKDAYPALPTSYREAMMLAVERYEQLEVANKLIAIAAPKAKVYDEVVADKDISLRQIVRMFHGVNSMQTQGDLTRMGYLYKNSDGINVYAKYKDTYFSERVIEQNGFRQITVCAKGKELLGELYAAGRLTMKVGHQVRV
jgi:phage antirepressor YoqD-like protein